MEIAIYYVDAFTDQAFKGNPAAVCYLYKDLDDNLKQRIAKEIGFSETAFVRELDPEIGHFALQWFTPKTEVKLCGHATLATSSIIFKYYKSTLEQLSFETKSGILKAKRIDDLICLDFPLDIPNETTYKYQELAHNLSIKSDYQVLECHNTGNLLFILDNEQQIKDLMPDYLKLAKMDISPFSGVIASAMTKGEYDIVSRYFTPWEGINEDPVTGSAHTCLLPYWSGVFGKTKLSAKQISEREGVLSLELLDDRALIKGKSVVILEGTLKNVR